MPKKIIKLPKENSLPPPEIVEEVKEVMFPKVLPITQEFGNGDMNILKDKINEIISNR
jgi:hypothetical protein